MKRWVTYTIAIVAILVVVLGIWYAISLQASSNFAIANTSPANNATNFDPSKPIVIGYTQALKLDQSKEDIKISPKTTASVEIVNSTITVTPIKPLLEHTSYIISLNNIQSSSGKTLTTTITFKTGQNRSARAEFIRTLPRYASNYSISYNSITDSFLVIVTKLPYDQAKSDAMQHIKIQGLNPNIERINYEILRSLEGKGAPPG